MYLKALEINGFKSFAKKGQFDFSRGISAIVGPNGSGKSNVAEAFRFVLGEQSLKNMRSKKGTDLLFAGHGTNLHRASVKVTLDNSDKKLDIDYGEVTIERAVTRDGSNEYFINKSKVRAKDIVELLAGANVGSTGHHIISQGEADKILNINARERKQVIEDALGLKVYTIKKAEALRKLEKTKDNLKEIKTEERTTLPKLNYLKREVDKIEQARNLREELRGLYGAYLPHKSLYVNKQASLKQELTELEEQSHTLEKQLAQERAAIQKGADDDTDKELAAKQAELEHKLLALRQEKNDSDRAVAKLEAVIEFEQEHQRKKEQAQEQETEKLSRLGAGIHSLWQNWANPVLKEEDISPERTNLWLARMKDFDQLDENLQQAYRTDAQTLAQLVDKQEERDTLPHRERIDASIKEKEVLVARYQELLAREQELAGEFEAVRKQVDNPELANQQKQIEILELEKKKSDVAHALGEHQRELAELAREIEKFATEELHAQELFGIEAQDFARGEVGDELNLHEKIIRTRTLLEHSGGVGGEDTIAEYQELARHIEYIKGEVSDLEQTMQSLQDLVVDLENKIEERFRSGMEQINESFNTFFSTLFAGGGAHLELVKIPVNSAAEDDNKEYELGVEMKVSLPNKKVTQLTVLSGGERSLTSIALLFAMSQVAPPPFIILDETDAALDEANSKRYSDMVEKLAERSQLIVITHNRETMSRAGVLYGVTMGDDGISRLLSVSFDEAQAVAK